MQITMPASKMWDDVGAGVELCTAFVRCFTWKFETLAYRTERFEQRE